MIRIGLSGWSHPSWVGPFYPVGLRERPEAWLKHYATRFRSVEIASTFDAMPDDDLVTAWARAGVELSHPHPFEFSLGLPRAATHEALASLDVERAWELAARFERAVCEPLADEGLLGAVRVALPSGFGPTSANVEAVGETLRALSGRHLVIDPADPSWGTSPEAGRLFFSRDVCLAESGLDAPRSTARHAFLRLDRPTMAELRDVAERARAHAVAEREVRIVVGDATTPRAVADALDVMELLGQAPALPRPRLTEQRKLPM